MGSVVQVLTPKKVPYWLAPDPISRKLHNEVVAPMVHLKTPTVGPVVAQDMPEVQAAAQLEAEKLKKKKGYKNTILTGPMGLGDNAITTKATLG
jgi:hypothetical protein